MVNNLIKRKKGHRLRARLFFWEAAAEAIQVLLVLIIRLYRRHFTAHRVPVCRFYPTCSEYAIESIKKGGVFRGGLRALLRVMKCHPFAAGGYDPPRQKQEKQLVDE